MNDAFPWRDLAAVQQVDLTPDYDTAEIREILEVWVEAAESLTTLDDQAVAWALIQKIKQSAAIIESVLAPKMHEQIPREPGWIDTPAGVFKRHWRGTKWHWNQDGVVRELVDAARTQRNFNAATGEVEGEAEAFARHLRAVAAINYFRIKDLQKLGVDPYPYRTREDGDPWVAPA